MSITHSPRTEFTAAHVTPEAKKALGKLARRQRKSVSAVVSEAIEEKLERDAVEPVPVETALVVVEAGNDPA